jgi:hypothetical protein
VLAAAGAARETASPMLTAGRNNVVPVWSPDSHRIAFVTDGTGANLHDVWVMDADGSNARNLTPDTLSHGVPAWAPNGAQLAFLSAPVAGTSPATVDLVDADGGDLRTLVVGSAPAWSPDGRQIAYVGSDGVHVVGVDGTGDRLVAPTGASTGIGGAPTWSPDGSQLAYVDGRDVWAVRVDGSDRRALTSFPADQFPLFASTPAWSPNGSAIAFVAVPPYSGGVDDAWIVRPDGGTPKRLASFAFVDSGASWMPDGRAFVLTAAKRRDGDVDLYRLALDGSAPVDISNDRVWDEGAAVAPDGRSVAFGVRYGTGFESSDIWTLDLRSGRRRNLTGTSTGLTVAARSVRPPNRLVLRSVTTSVDSSFGQRPILRVRAHVQDARRNDVGNAVVTVTPSLPSLIAMKPTHRTDVHGETELDFRAATARVLRPGLRLMLVVRAHPPGPNARAVRATRRISVRV